jgi:hypothetical protein
MHEGVFLDRYGYLQLAQMKKKDPLKQFPATSTKASEGNEPQISSSR